MGYEHRPWTAQLKWLRGSPAAKLSSWLVISLKRNNSKQTSKKTWHNIDQHVFFGLSKKNIDWMAIVTLFVDVFSPVLQSDSEVMLYEMLVGSRPFRGTNNIFVLYCRFGKQWAVFKTPVGWWFVWGLYYPMYWIPFLTNQFAFYIN